MGMFKGAIWLVVLVAGCSTIPSYSKGNNDSFRASKDGVCEVAQQALVSEARSKFRYETFDSELFWGDQLGLQEVFAGSLTQPGITPRQVLALGIKVNADVVLCSDEIPKPLNLDDPATTLRLLRNRAIIGFRGFERENKLYSVGIECALCHSNVDDEVAPGVGRQLDGFPNKQIDIGALISLAPNLAAMAALLETDPAKVQALLKSWGPGYYDSQKLKSTFHSAKRRANTGYR